MFRLLVIIFFLPPNILTLKCVPPGFNQTFSFNDSDLFEFNQILHDLEPSDQKGYCAVQINANYMEQIIFVLAGRVQDGISLNFRSLVELQTYIVPGSSKTFMNLTFTVNRFIIVCRSDDLCDRRYMLDHLGWLIKTDNHKLENAVHPLLVNASGETGHCIVGAAKNQSQPCPSQVCTWVSSGVPGCVNDLQQNPMLMLTTTSILLEDHQVEGAQRDRIRVQQKLTYFCQWSSCNNDSVADQIIEAINNDYDWSAMKKVLDAEANKTFENKGTTVTTTMLKSTNNMNPMNATSLVNISMTTSASGTTTTIDKKPGNNSASLQIWISTIIFGILLIICNVL